MQRTQYTPWSLSVVEDEGPGQQLHLLPGVSFKSPPAHLSQAAKEQWMQLVSQNSVRTAAAPEQQAQLKALWNSSLPINRIPIELLVFIFILSTDCGEYDLSFSALDGRCNIPRVCRYWYDLALSTPTLWRTVDTGTERTRRKYVTHCLNSSAASPLHVFIHAPQFCEADLALFFPHVGRMETLDIESTRWESRPMLFFSHKFALLKTLRLLGTDTRDELHLSAERFPVLQVLEIAGESNVPMDPQIYASLHTLKLIGCPSDLSLSEFFDLLSTCLDLEELCIFGVLGNLVQDYHITSTASRPRTMFQRMKSLYLGDYSCDGIFPFFSRFACPQSACVDVVGKFDLGSQDDVDENGDNYIQLSTMALPSDPLSESLSPISRVQRIVLDCIWGDLTGDNYELSLYGCDADGFSVVRFTFNFRRELEPYRWRSSLNDQVVFIRTAFRGAPLTQLKISVFNTMDEDPAPVRSKEWSNVLKAFPALESLHLQEWFVARRLWGALKPKPDVAVPCSRLRSICLMEETGGWFTAGEIPEAREFFDDMVDALRERAARGVQLQQLDLRVVFEEYEPDGNQWELDRDKHSVLQDSYLSTLGMLVDKVTYTLESFPQGDV